MNNISSELPPKVMSASERRDLWRTAIHEAGHVYMARKFKNQHVRAVICRNPAGGRHQHFWTGQCRWVSIKRPAEKHKKLIGVAGFAAECVWESMQPEAYFDLSSALLDGDVMSASDWASSGCQPNTHSPKLFDLVEKAIDMLWEDWAAVAGEAMNLIRLTRADIEEEIQYCIEDKEFDMCDALRHDLTVIDDVLVQHA
jgi:hypothetical protein